MKKQEFNYSKGWNFYFFSKLKYFLFYLGLYNPKYQDLFGISKTDKSVWIVDKNNQVWICDKEELLK